MLVYFLLLIAFSTLSEVQLFRIPRGWALRKQFPSKVVSNTRLRAFESVYIGNLPVASDIDQLRDLLVKHGISEYKELELLRYDPDEEDKYGRVVFEEESMAQNAVKLLHNATVDDRQIDAALLTNRTRLFGRSTVLNITKTDVKADINAFLGSEEILRCQMYPTEARYAFLFLQCKSPARALRALSKLSSYRYLNQPVPFCTANDFVVKPHGVFVGNIHPNIKHRDLVRILDELLGPGQVERLSIPYSGQSGISKGFAFVYFHSAEQARRAVEILNGRVLMDRTLKATLDGRSEAVSTEEASAKYTEFKAYLGNIDVNTTQESIEKLCNDVLAGSSGSAGVGGVSTVQFLRTKSGVFLPSCFVYFHDASSRDLCVSALNGTKWNDRELFCMVAVDRDEGWHFPQSTKIYLRYFPQGYSQEQATRVIEEILGEKTLRGLHLGKENGQDTRGIHLLFYTEDQAKRALEVLNGKIIKGIKQRALPSLTVEQLSRYKSGYNE